jgi:hypothetical protein
MRNEDALLYLCCVQDLSAERTAQIVAAGAEAPLDWTQVVALARGHGVSPLVYRSLLQAMASGLAVPDEVVQKLKLATYQSIITKQGRHTQLSSVLAFLNANGLDVMAIKGVALDLLVYDQVWYTESEDVDLILRPRQADLPYAGLLQVQRALHGLGIEYEFYVHHDVDLNQTLPIDFKAIWHSAQLVDFAGQPLYLMAPEDMLLAVCINSCRKRYFRLRSLCDIAETIKRFPDLDWPRLACRAAAYECNNIVYTALSVAQATVGCPLPEETLDQFGLPGMRRRAVDAATRYLVQHVPLSSLSFYHGARLAGRKFGWSLVLPYLTYRWRQAHHKLHEALADFRGPLARQI